MINLNKKLILASKSPRRSLLLEKLGFQFEIITSNINENDFIKSNMTPSEFASNLALMKARDVANQINSNIQNFESYVLGADTIVLLDNMILNKPIDKLDAKRMLRLLSGRNHSVFTGLALIETPQMNTIVDFKETQVSFRELDENEIESYVASGSPLDKAGSYGIQDDFGAVFVNHIVGCYYNIVGLPLELFYRMLKNISNNNL